MRTSRYLLLAAILAAPVVYLACGDDDSGGTPNKDSGTDTAQGDSSSPDLDSSTPDSGGDTGTDGGGGLRGPTSMDFDPAGNGNPDVVAWDDVKKVLYIADGKNNQIWSWTDAAGFKKLVKVLDNPIADDAGHTQLDEIAILSDGRLVMPRFGFGSVGTILTVDPVTGDAGEIPVAANRKRVALAVGAADQLWGGYFFAPGDHNAVVTKDSLTGETDYAYGFDKPVSVLVQDGHLLVSEQFNSTIYSLPLDGGFADGGPYDIFASVPSCDALTGGPNGSVITGQFKPLTDGGPYQLRQAFPDGGYQVIQPDSGLARPSSVAYDKTNKRVFVADSNGTTIRTVKIFPVD